MVKYPVLKQIRITSQEAHYLDVLSKKYCVNSSQFIRAALIEKLQRDMPKIREDYKEKFTFKIPF
jgi:hypothetical protein